MSAEVAPSPPVKTPPVRKPRRWRRRIVALLVLLSVGVWFAPTVVARTGLRNRIARAALVDLRGTVDVGRASFGWFAPVELRDVVVTDAQGRVLLTAPGIASSKTLLALLRDRSDLGEFVVERPVAEVVCEKEATNLEDAIANYLKDTSPPSSSRPAVSVRVHGGTLRLRDTDTDATFEAVELTATVPASRTEPIAVNVQARASSTPPGSIEADLSVGEGGTATLKAVEFPLDSLAPLLRRVDPQTKLAGRLTADVSARWNRDDPGRPTATVEGSAAVRDFALDAPWLNGDQLRLASAELPLKLELTGTRVRIDRAALTCDAGTLSATGSFDPGEPLDRILDKPGMKLEADVDLAKLAALLPRVLRVREGTAVREGKLVVKVGSRESPDGTTWDGEVHTSALRAERGGKPIEWAEPLGLEFSGRFPAGHLPTFDKFVCRSDFLAVNAKGSPESFRAAANVYLDRLMTRLGEFVEVGGLRVMGEASAWVIASRTAAGEFKADAGVELKEFQFANGPRKGFAEKLLTVKASAAGTWPHGGTVRLASGSASLTAGADTLGVTLAGPLEVTRQTGTLTVNLTGDFDRWVGRVRRAVRIPPKYIFGGTATVRGTVRFQPAVVAVDDLRVGIERAQFRGAGLLLDEPYLNATAALTLSRATGTAEFNRLRIWSPVFHLTDGRLAIESPPGGDLAVGGSGTAVTDLERLGKTLKLQSDPKGGDALHGRGVGPVRFRWQGDTTTFGGTLDVKDFAYGDPKVTGITEPTLKLDLDGKYDETPDRVTLARARVERPGMTVDAKGTLAKFDATQDIAIDGTLAYDLAKLTPDLRNSLGGGFQAAGQGSRPFALSGSLAPGGSVVSKVGPSPSPLAKLSADAGLGWDSVKAYGFDMGQGELKLKLVNGLATVSPIKATFGGGQVALTPSLRLAPDPVELSFARGKVVDRAKLTPAMCAGALGYALPVIANAAQATGELSATLDDNRVPLADVTKTSLKGQLLVHKATVSPGPVVTEIAKLLGAASTTMTLANEMTVPVRVEGGRVYHENLAVTVNGYTIKTTGSVGFDGSLALVADVPIPGTFPGLKNNPALKKAFEGKIVRVPVGGTVAKPAVDQRQFQAAVAAVARDAAKDAGRDLLNRELEKLFPGMPAPKK